MSDAIFMALELIRINLWSVSPRGSRGLELIHNNMLMGHLFIAIGALLHYYWDLLVLIRRRNFLSNGFQMAHQIVAIRTFKVFIEKFRRWVFPNYKDWFSLLSSVLTKLLSRLDSRGLSVDRTAKVNGLEVVLINHGLQFSKVIEGVFLLEEGFVIGEISRNPHEMVVLGHLDLAFMLHIESRMSRELVIVAWLLHLAVFQGLHLLLVQLLLIVLPLLPPTVLSGL
jgi:hypothetical protein